MKNMELIKIYHQKQLPNLNIKLILSLIFPQIIPNYQKTSRYLTNLSLGIDAYWPMKMSNSINKMRQIEILGSLSIIGMKMLKNIYKFSRDFWQMTVPFVTLFFILSWW